jgi:predicted DNA-binding protein YlxM (UPF0122 family)
MLSKVLRITPLYDFYGPLLTVKQKRCIEMHYLEDLSLSEIAAEFAVSRQAVFDILRRAEQVLEEYERALHLVERYKEKQQTVRQVYELMTALPDGILTMPATQQAMQKLQLLLD